MNVLLVTYDLAKGASSENYASILNIIKSEKNWARLSESSYAMQTNMTPQAIYDRMRPVLKDGDDVLIFTLSTPYFGRSSKEVIDWLGEKMKV